MPTKYTAGKPVRTKRIALATNILELEHVHQRHVSTAAGLVNTSVGTCPKCACAMSDAIVRNVGDVFYCETCRVATPKLN